MRLSDIHTKDDAKEFFRLALNGVEEEIRQAAVAATGTSIHDINATIAFLRNRQLWADKHGDAWPFSKWVAEALHTLRQRYRLRLLTAGVPPKVAYAASCEYKMEVAG